MLRPILPLCIGVLLLFPVSLASTCPKGKFIKEGQCVPCPVGTHGIEQNSTSCQKCSPGSYNRFTGASGYAQCLECPYDTFSQAGATECKPCPDGTFSRKGYAQCRTCPPGKMLSEYGFEACRTCPGAFYRPADAPPHTCLLCPSGTGSRSLAKSCFRCPKGTYRDIQFISRKRMSGCRGCRKNQFANVKGSVQCKLCPLGSVAEDKGSKKCTSCPPGTFRGRIIQAKCLPCSKGTNSRGMMPAGCKHPVKGCPVNTYEDRFGECRACMPGERLNREEKKCIPCGRDEVSLGGIATACKTCPPGQRPANANTIFEKSRCECLDGTVTDGVGGCKKCPKGTHWTNRPAGAIWYTNKRENYYRDSYCYPCELGSFADEEGLSECKLCPSGTFTNIEGSTRCIRCPKGYVSPPGNPLDSESSEGFFATRSDCLAERSGCSLGEDPNKRGGKFEDCISSGMCPPNRFRGRFGCDSCGFDQFYDSEKGRCRNCPRGSVTMGGGAFLNCTICPKGAISAFNGMCECIGFYGDDGRGGCKKCPEGEISIQGKCAPCGEDSFFNITRYGPECIQCTGGTIMVREGQRRCTECPDGFKKEKDVFGEGVNNCVPKDMYPVVN